MQVPFLDLKAQHAALETELTEAFRRIVRDAAFVGGPEVEAFEREFAAFCHSKGAVGVGSGTDALRFAYLAMGVKPGDEVITVPNTFIATTEALTQAGASVSFVDVLPDTLLMDPARLAAAITPRTVGIVPVHLYGTPADMDPIQEIACAHEQAIEGKMAFADKSFAEVFGVGNQQAPEQAGQFPIDPDQPFGGTYKRLSFGEVVGLPTLELSTDRLLGQKGMFVRQ